MRKLGHRVRSFSASHTATGGGWSASQTRGSQQLRVCTSEGARVTYDVARASKGLRRETAFGILTLKRPLKGYLKVQISLWAAGTKLMTPGSVPTVRVARTETGAPRTSVPSLHGDAATVSSTALTPVNSNPGQLSNSFSRSETRAPQNSGNASHT